MTKKVVYITVKEAIAVQNIVNICAAMTEKYRHSELGDLCYNTLSKNIDCISPLLREIKELNFTKEIKDGH